MGNGGGRTEGGSGIRGGAVLVPGGQTAGKIKRVGETQVTQGQLHGRFHGNTTRCPKGTKWGNKLVSNWWPQSKRHWSREGVRLVKGCGGEQKRSWLDTNTQANGWSYTESKRCRPQGPA